MTEEIVAQIAFSICFSEHLRIAFPYLSDCNWIRTHNHLVHKRTLNHLAKLASLAKWLSVRL